MLRSFKCLLGPALTVCSVTLAIAQTSQPTQSSAAQQPTQSGLTLHSSTQLVVVDVVVTDKQHKPVHNLKASDFMLLEKKVLQQIRNFEEHVPLSPSEAKNSPPPPALPPGIFTNFTPVPPNSALTILLIDGLNTSLDDQPFMRAQMADYVTHARPGTSIAIFGLTNSLHMLQGFTSDPEVLSRAVGVATGKSTLTVGAQTALASGTNSVVASRPDAAQAASSLKAVNQIGGSFAPYVRVRLTLEAFDVLARYLSYIPGRKNLIWFSGSFPLTIYPNQSINEHDSFAGTSAEDALHETSNLLTRSQVAVYPIDVRGVAVSRNFSAQRPGSVTARGFSRNEASFSNQLASGRATMESMASDTGGRAFYNTNGLSKAASEAVDEGSNYYTITYAPADTNRHGEFRDIKLALDKEGLQLAYRRGYYADRPIPASTAPSFAAQDPASPAADPVDSTARKSMIHGVPEPTEILFKVRALPASDMTENAVVSGTTINAPGFAAAKAPFRRYILDFAAFPSTISFSTTSDGHRHAVVEFETLVYQPDGTIVTQQINTTQATLDAANYSALMKEGLHFHQEISVPEKGEFYLRTGVHDLTSNRVGAVEFPVASIRHLAPAQDNPVAPTSAK